MSLSRRTQQAVALSLGIVLVGVIIATLVSEYGPSDSGASNDSGSSRVVVGSTNQDGKGNAIEPPKQDANPEDGSSNVKNFEFTAQAGASYTSLARNAVRQYASLDNLNLTDAQVEKAAAELAYDAGLPYLEIGQVVVISSPDVSAILGIKTKITTPTGSTKTPPVEDKKSVPVTKSYTFVAAKGDAYCLFARSAISDYAQRSNLELSGAQRIAAETFIISDAGFPRLAISQQVTFDQTTIKNAADKALSLTPTQLANWQPYANLAGL